MKRKLIIIVVIIITITAIAARLIINKQSREAELESIIRINPVIPVTVDTVRFQNILETFALNGVFEAGAEVIIASETQGTVTSVLAETGDRVKENQVLAKTDNAVLLSQLGLAKAAFEKAEKDYHRFEELSKEQAASLQQFEAARLAYINAEADLSSAQKVYNNSVVKAPVSGTITKRYIEKGSFLSPGTPAYEIVSIQKVKFAAALSADEAAGIRAGDLIEITADALPRKTFTGKVSSIVIKADDSKRFRVEAEINNDKEQSIKPGIFGKALFKGNNNSNLLVIPRKALSGSIKDPEVFVVTGDSVILKKIAARPVNGKYMSINGGLKPGELVVISGQINLKNGTKIKVNK
jgi:RND family efflux transporter MFP subunit